MAGRSGTILIELSPAEYAVLVDSMHRAIWDFEYDDEAFDRCWKLDEKIRALAPAPHGAAAPEGSAAAKSSQTS